MTSDFVHFIQFVFFTGGIVFLTLIINGSTTQFILHLLGMDKLSETKVSALPYLFCNLLVSALPYLFCNLFHKQVFCLFCTNAGK